MSKKIYEIVHQPSVWRVISCKVLFEPLLSEDTNLILPKSLEQHVMHIQDLALATKWTFLPQELMLKLAAKLPNLVSLDLDAECWQGTILLLLLDLLIFPN